MTIRFAREEDIPRIDQLLLQVCQVHHQGRPDLFQIGRASCRVIRCYERC